MSAVSSVASASATAAAPAPTAAAAAVAVTEPELNGWADTGIILMLTVDWDKYQNRTTHRYPQPCNTVWDALEKLLVTIPLVSKSSIQIQIQKKAHSPDMSAKWSWTWQRQQQKEPSRQEPYMGGYTEVLLYGLSDAQRQDAALMLMKHGYAVTIDASTGFSVETKEITTTQLSIVHKDHPKPAAGKADGAVPVTNTSAGTAAGAASAATAVATATGAAAVKIQPGIGPLPMHTLGIWIEKKPTDIQDTKSATVVYGGSSDNQAAIKDVNNTPPFARPSVTHAIVAGKTVPVPPAALVAAAQAASQAAASGLQPIN